MSRPSHDSLGRRLPTSRRSTGKRMRPTERSLLWFERLNAYGPLPTSYLLEYSRLFGFRNEKKARGALTDLAHEVETPHGGPYLIRPPQQNVSAYPQRNRQLVYDVNARAKSALKEAGLYVEMGHSDHWMHRFVKACCIASIELAILQRARGGADLAFLPQHEILAGRSPRVVVPYAWRDAETGQSVSRRQVLIPDYLFAIDYGGKRRHFAVEVSRATEPNRASGFDRKSVRRSMLQYASLIGGGLHHDLFGFRNLLLLNVVTSVPAMRSMMDVVREIAAGPTNPEGKNNYILFKAIPDFTRPFMPPVPMWSLVAEPWERVGWEPFSLVGS